MLGPLLAGLAIGLLSGVFASTEGYAAMWGVWCSREPRFGAVPARGAGHGSSVTAGRRRGGGEGARARARSRVIGWRGRTCDQEARLDASPNATAALISAPWVSACGRLPQS